MKNTHGGVLQAKPATFLKVTLPHGCIFAFFKLNKWYQIGQRITYILKVNDSMISNELNVFKVNNEDNGKAPSEFAH